MIGINNPLNIRHSIWNPWRGEAEPCRGFCQFVTLEYGVRAACITLMRSYRKRGLKTIRQVLERWAPPSENNTDNYISFVCRKISMSPDEELRPKDYPYLIHAMSWMEVGFADCVTVITVREVIEKWDIKCKCI